MVIPDCKNASGLWAQKVGRNRTVSGQKWSDINNRCKVGGAFQIRRPTYIGCANKFTDFEAFANWHVKQVGYNRGWQIDKDLLVKGNMNKLIESRNKREGSYRFKRCSVFYRTPLCYREIYTCKVGLWSAYKCK